ncbi:MAG: flagellar biosynthesis anti-sigma factor FlgM [Planctomycetes bacterium]|nr:flagellar biosynthesis anti-sigma factor FlgM [Planctomycetota bacterium]
MKIDDNEEIFLEQTKNISDAAYHDIPPTRISVFINTLRRMPEVRWDKVNYLKALVQNGEYETEQRLKGAAKKVTAFLLKD